MTSTLLEISQTFVKWTRRSYVVQTLKKERVQLAIAGVVLLVSLESVFRSNMDTAVKFLSFLLLFVLTALVTWPLTVPSEQDHDT